MDCQCKTETLMREGKVIMKDNQPILIQIISCRNALDKCPLGGKDIGEIQHNLLTKEVKEVMYEVTIDTTAQGN